MKRSIAHSLMIGCFLLPVACGSSHETSEDGGDRVTLRNAEKDFDPSQYNPDVKTILNEELGRKKEQAGAPIEVSTPAPAELVSGFRVQMFASTNIDDASGQKEIAEEMFPGEWFYLVYDPPTYKLRAGNFLSRFEADRFLKQIMERGYRDSWIVPDRVFKDIGPRPETPPEEAPPNQQ